MSEAVSAGYSDETRRRGLRSLLIYTFFMVIGFTMVMPLVAVHFVDRIGMAAAAVGLALAVRQLAQQGLAIFGGLWSDRAGPRRMIVLGVLLRAVGFGALAFAHDLPSLLLAMIVSALGGALFEAPYQAAITSLTTEENRARYYSLSNTVSGIATTLGPLIGVALLRFDFQAVSLAAGACFAFNALIAMKLPHIEAGGPDNGFKASFSLVLHDRPFVLMTLLMMAYWFVSVQMNITFPLLVMRLTGSETGIGIMFALSAGMSIVLQYPLVRWLEKHLSTAQILIAGVLIMATGVAAMAFVSSFVPFLVCVAIFSLGAILTRPTQQSIIASMANPAAMGTFLGFSSLALAFGGGIGNVAGGWMFDQATVLGIPALPWIVFAGMAALCALGLGVLLGTGGAGQADK
ncbi:MAG: MFS transporter [Alphaproteobacteria bacterium HGW-Alphaproteobacteria-16]|nr:MAG: MFS transporter [Alphaproteobacteria bacterium HGW-Alphaproteobacteria-16]